VIELAAPAGLGQMTTFALASCAQAQQESRCRGGASAWCAWIDPEGTLYAPAVEAYGVDLDRLLFIRAPREKLAQVAVKVARSRIFSVIAIDVCALLGRSRASDSLAKWPNVVRRLAIGVERSDTIVLLLTDSDRARPMALPVAMRIDLERIREDRLGIRISKEKHGRTRGPSSIAWTRPTFDGEKRASAE
jgi:recombination protein RecA